MSDNAPNVRCQMINCDCCFCLLAVEGHMDCVRREEAWKVQLGKYLKYDTPPIYHCAWHSDQHAFSLWLRVSFQAAAARGANHGSSRA